MSARAGAPPPLSTCQTHSCMADWLVLVSLLLLDLGLFAIGRPVSSSTHPGISCVWMGSLEYREAPCVCVCVGGGAAGPSEPARAGETTHWVGELAALAEDLGFVSRAHTTAHNHLTTPVPGSPEPSSGIVGAVQMFCTNPACRQTRVLINTGKHTQTQPCLGLTVAALSCFPSCTG